jgi:hypothetical protein
MTRAHRPAKEESTTLISSRLAIERPFTWYNKQNSIHEPGAFIIYRATGLLG